MSVVEYCDSSMAEVASQAAIRHPSCDKDSANAKFECDWGLGGSTGCPGHAGICDNVGITVTPWLAPNKFGSPSFTPAEANAVAAMQQGLSTNGAAGPAQFNAQTTPVTSSQVVVTNFNSWMGDINPAATFGAAYANELGNRMTFGLAVNGTGRRSRFRNSRSLDTVRTPRTLWTSALQPE